MKLNGQNVQFVDSYKLDDEVVDSSTQNVITSGDPCTNGVIAQVFGHSNCNVGLSEGKSRIKLMKWPNGKELLLVTGFSANERRVAAKVLAHRSGELSGSEVEISGSNPQTYQTATITKIN